MGSIITMVSLLFYKMVSSNIYIYNSDKSCENIRQIKQNNEKIVGM